jgi:hypothetical protein
MTWQDRYIPQAIGPFAPEQLHIIWNDELLELPENVEAEIAATWDRQKRLCQARGAMLFNGQLVRCLGFAVRNGHLQIQVGPTDFAHFLGTNFENHHLGDTLGWEHFSNPIGTSALIRTPDDWLLFGRRSQLVACQPGYVHTFGGSLELAERQDDGTFDAYQSIRRELREELLLQEAEISNLICLGMIQDAEIRQPELIFEAVVTTDRQTLTDRVHPEVEDQEHEGVEFCRNRPESIDAFLATCNLLAPVAAGALLVYRDKTFGGPS